MSRLLALALPCVLLAACAAQPPAPEQHTVTGPDIPAVNLPERPIPSESLYPLLVAEFALRQRAYDIALDEYMALAVELRDAGVSEHTTRLSQFLRRDEEALQSAQLWVELDPDNVEANNTLAELLILRGRTVEALPYLEAVERNGGSANFPLLINRFAALSEQQQLELAQGVDALATEFPDNSRIRLTRALIHTEYERYDQALDELDTLLDQEPEQPQALLLEARILIELDAQKPYARLERVLQKYPEDKILRLQYAGLLTATDMDAARQQFEILLEQSPDDGDLLFSLALINRETGNRETAREYLLRSLELGQRTDEAYYYLGRMAEEDNETNSAITYYMAVTRGDEYLAANSRIGQILVNEGQLDISRDWFALQRNTHPQLRAQLYSLEADILARDGREKDALRLLNEALQEMPDNTPLRYTRAMLLEKLDDLDAMERDLRTILAAEPDNATALNALGYTLADRTSRHAEALDLISRALALQPNEPAILDSMGWVLYRTGRYEESTQYLYRAYETYPDPEVAAHLGEVLWIRGDTEAAREIWQEALARDPDHPIVVGTMNRLGVDIPALSPSEESGDDHSR